MREYCVAKGAMHRANRLDPSLREVRLLRMTIKLWRSAGCDLQSCDSLAGLPVGQLCSTYWKLLFCGFAEAHRWHIHAFHAFHVC